MAKTYQWLRCDSSGANCVDLAGATGSTYAAVAGDVGRTIRVRASDGVVTLTSGQTSVVTGTPSPSGVWYPNSAWGAAIPASPSIHSNSDAIIQAHFVAQGSNSYNNYWLGPRNSSPGYGAAAAVAVPSASTPLVTVQINYPSGCGSSFMQVPIPAGFDVGSASSSENKAVIFDPSGTGEWNFFDLTPPFATTFDYTNEAGFAHCTPNANWQALIGYHFASGGFNATITTPGFPWSDSDNYMACGLIRQRDIINTPVGGNWGHALCLDFAGNSNGAVNPRSVFPATSGDGLNGGAGGGPMGARYQLDPAINVDTWPSLSAKPEWLKQMCRTLQVYGAISVHSAVSQGGGDGLMTEWYKNFGGWLYPWQAPGGTVADYYASSMNVPADLLSHFRVLDWNWHWAVGNP